MFSNDLDGDGLQDANEPGIAGATVTLENDQGITVATQTTGDDGQYLFEDLTPDSYKITVDAPDGFVFTNANQGSDDSVDSDIDPNSGMSGLCQSRGGR